MIFKRCINVAGQEILLNIHFKYRLKCDVELLCIWREVCHPCDSNSGIGKIFVYKNFDA